MRKFLLVLTLGSVLVLTGGRAASAQVFSSRALWIAALSGSPTTVDFEGLVSSPGDTIGPFVLSGATFNSTQFPFVVNDAGTGSTAYDWNSGAVFSPQVTAPSSIFNQMFVTLPGGFLAAGFSYGQNFNGIGVPNKIDLSNGNAYFIPDNSNWPNLAFWGVITSTPFSSYTVSILDQSWAPIFDDVSWGDPAATGVVPEPASMTLLATGLVGMVAARRRRRKA